VDEDEHGGVGELLPEVEPGATDVFLHL
jgi:hypothetical protein